MISATVQVPTKAQLLCSNGAWANHGLVAIPEILGHAFPVQQSHTRSVSNQDDNSMAIFNKKEITDALFHADAA